MANRVNGGIVGFGFFLKRARQGLAQPIPPKDKYYLVDSRYTNMSGFLSPYREECYHSP